MHIYLDTPLVRDLIPPVGVDADGNPAVAPLFAMKMRPERYSSAGITSAASSSSEQKRKKTSNESISLG